MKKKVGIFKFEFVRKHEEFLYVASGLVCKNEEVSDLNAICVGWDFASKSGKYSSFVMDCKLKVASFHPDRSRTLPTPVEEIFAVVFVLTRSKSWLATIFRS